MDKGEKAGKLIFLDKETFQRAFEMEVGESHVIRSAWHPKLNQILVGSGDGVVRYRSFCIAKGVSSVKCFFYQFHPVLRNADPDPPWIRIDFGLLDPDPDPWSAGSGSGSM
jgi:hypothetical protein